MKDMEEEEKGATTANSDAPREQTHESITKHTVEPLPPRRKLPHWDKPRSQVQSVSRINKMLQHWARMTEETAYRVGKEFIWLKNSLPHGGFQNAVAATPLKIRTVQHLMHHARECDQVNRILPYH